MPKILVIEDDPAILRTTVEVLNLEGFETLSAENGLQGLEQAQHYLPDLIISDIMMPVLDGHEVLEALHQDPATATIPFIFLTAQTNRADMRTGMDKGADDYLSKPFTTSELLRAVNARLKKHDVIVQKHEQKLDDLRDNMIHMLPHELRS